MRSAISPRLAISTFSNISLNALSARLRGEREGTHRVRDGEGEVGLAGGRYPPPHPDPLRPQGRRGRALGVPPPPHPQCFPSHPRSKTGSRDSLGGRFLESATHPR